MRVDDHVARIVPCAKDSLNDCAEIERFGPADFNDAIQGSAPRNLRDSMRDVVGGKGLDTYRRHTNGLAWRSGVGDTLQELEELRGLHDRVRDRRVFDQRLLRTL